MKTTNNRKVLIHQYAQELTDEEIKYVAGGGPPDCTGTAEVTWDESTGKDAKVDVSCDF